MLGHTKLVSTVRYLGIEVEDAPKISEQTESSTWKLGRTLGALIGYVWSLSGVMPYA